MDKNSYEQHMLDTNRSKKVGGYQPGVDVVTLPAEVVKNIAKLFASLGGDNKPKPPKYPPEG